MAPISRKLRAGLLQPLLVAIERGDLRARLRKIDRDRTADAAAPPVTTQTRPDRPSQSEEFCDAMTASLFPSRYGFQTA